MTLEHLLSECDNYCRLSKGMCWRQAPVHQGRGGVLKWDCVPAETYADAIEELRDAFNVYDRCGEDAMPGPG
jgi:hypothetical protein